jgi:hypothetical protein
MAKPLPRLRVASAGNPPTIFLKDAEWSKIEAAYKQPLSSELRELIRDRTNAYLSHAQFELAAEPLKHAQVRLKQVKNAAAKFQAELMRASEFPEATHHANFLMKKNFVDSRLKCDRPNDGIHVLCGIMTSVIVACHHAQKDLEENRPGGFQPGQYWKVWVRDLAVQLKEHELPTGVRKDVDKKKDRTPSPFAAFIFELQKFIPPEYRRGDHSAWAVTELISKARRARG